MKTQCIVFLTHFINPSILDRYFLIKNTVKCADTYLVLDTTNSMEDDYKKYIDVLEQYFIEINVSFLTNMGYVLFDYEKSLRGIENHTTLLGNNHMVLYYVYEYLNNKNVEYDYYWKLDYDVYMTKNYNKFFDSINNMDDFDLLMGYVRYFNDEVEENVRKFQSKLSKMSIRKELDPCWYPYCKDISKNIVYSFLPFYSLSSKFLKDISSYQLYDKNYKGHSEIVLPTFLLDRCVMNNIDNYYVYENVYENFIFKEYCKEDNIVCGVNSLNMKENLSFHEIYHPFKILQ